VYYTATSDPCTAARHFGAIKHPKGGVFKTTFHRDLCGPLIYWARGEQHGITPENFPKNFTGNVFHVLYYS